MNDENEDPNKVFKFDEGIPEIDIEVIANPVIADTRMLKRISLPNQWRDARLGLIKIYEKSGCKFISPAFYDIPSRMTKAGELREYNESE